MTESEITVDVAVVGGGAAGLSGATALARSRRAVLLIDAGEPRNGPAAAAHNVLGHDGIAPGELLAKGKAELASYGGKVRADTVTGATRSEVGFTLDLASGVRVRARRLLLASGLVDELPDIPGVAERWGRDVLHCPYCHGWEVRDQRLVVLGSGPMSVHQTMLFRQLSDTVTLVRAGMPDLTDAEAAQLDALGVEVVDAPVQRLEVTDDRLTAVVLADGRRCAADAVVVASRLRARGELFEKLGGTLTPHPLGEFITADPMGATELPGVWAAGNASNLSAMVSVAAGAGMMAGAAINADLVFADTARAAGGR